MKRTALLAVLGFSLVPGLAFSNGNPLRSVGPERNWTLTDAAVIDPAWLHVKFVEGAEVTTDGISFADLGGLELVEVQTALSATHVEEIRRTFRHERSLLRQWKGDGERRSGVVGPDLSLWFDVKVAGGPGQVVQLVNALNACASIEIAHPAPVVESAVLRSGSERRTVSRVAAGGAGPAARGATPDFTDRQDYLYDAPVGLEAPSAWATPGGGGAGLKFIDVELAWTENHEDFDTGNFFYEGGAAQNGTYEPHGTAVLGEVIGQHNSYGISGFSPDVAYGVVAIAIGDWPIVPQWFQEAVDQLAAGDVWLIELQTTETLPMEYYQVNYDVIWTGVWSRGVVCVEAGANGGHNLDSSQWGGAFDREVRDSGAILVGAGTPYGLVAESWSNYGSRIDVHAWGSEIATAGYGDLYNGGSLQTRYTDVFGGTSGASPMVTGSSLCLQGIALENQSRVLDPIELRALLRDTGSPHQGTREIGPRPNLTAAIDALLNSASIPDLGALSRIELSSSPNPFHTSSEIRFVTPSAGFGTLSVHDASGREVRRLISGWIEPGLRIFAWDGKNDSGVEVGSGVYFYRLQMPEQAGSVAIQRVR